MGRLARPQMKAGGGGSIVAMSYYGSEKVVPGYNVMGVAKGALECSCRFLASDLRPVSYSPPTLPTNTLGF